MKKFFEYGARALSIFILLAVLLGGTKQVYGVENKRESPDFFTQGQFRNGVSTTLFRIDYDGNIQNGRNLASDIGQSSGQWRNVYFGNLIVSSGIGSWQETWNNLATSSSDAYRVNGLTVSTNTLIRSGTNYSDFDFTESFAFSTGAPRDVILQAYVGVNPATQTITLSAIVYGTDSRGFARQETVAFSTTIGRSNNAWTFISSVAISASSVCCTIEDVKIQVGIGNKIGLGNYFDRADDIYKIIEGSTTVRATDPQVTISPTFGTITPKNVPNQFLDYIFMHRGKRTFP